MKTFLHRLFRPVRIWWRARKLHMRGLKTKVLPYGHLKVMHIYDDMGLKDVVIFK